MVLAVIHQATNVIPATLEVFNATLEHMKEEAREDREKIFSIIQQLLRRRTESENNIEIFVDQHGGIQQALQDPAFLPELTKQLENGGKPDGSHSTVLPVDLRDSIPQFQATPYTVPFRNFGTPAIDEDSQARGNYNSPVSQTHKALMVSPFSFLPRIAQLISNTFAQAAHYNRATASLMPSPLVGAYLTVQLNNGVLT